MAFCGQCGFENPDGARFCGSCGADLTQQEVGNVETLVNEKEGTPAQEDEPMAYVPLDTPSIPQPEPPKPATPTPPVVPPAPQPAPQPTRPVPQPAPQPTQPVPQPAPQPAPVAVHVNTDTPPPPQQPKQSNTKKTCLGCGCAAGVVLLLAIGGLAWWGYSAYKEHNKDIEEVLKWVDQGHQEYEQNKKEAGDDWEFEEGEGIENIEGVDVVSNGEEPSDDDEARNVSPSPNGTSAQKLAQELKVPVVSYNALPKNDMYYSDKDGELGVKFDLTNQRGSSSVGTMEINHWVSGKKFKFNIQSCGNSLYQLDNPQDKNMKRYMFVYEGGKRILMGDQKGMQELTMN